MSRRDFTMGGIGGGEKNLGGLTPWDSKANGCISKGRKEHTDLPHMACHRIGKSGTISALYYSLPGLLYEPPHPKRRRIFVKTP